MSRGFTLIELLYTLVVAALILTIGLPSFQGSVRNSRMTTSVNDMVATLQLARSEAIKRRIAVAVCPTGGDMAEDAGCAPNASWALGWIVFVDDSGNGARENGEQLLRQVGPIPSTVTIETPQNQPLQGLLSYLPTGFPDLGGLAAAGVMVFCDDRENNKFGRLISIPQTGRPVATPVSQRLDLGDCE